MEILLRRTRSEKFWTWKPTEPPYNDQKGFFDSVQKIQLAQGGNRSGKSEVGAAKDVYLLQGIHPAFNRKPPIYGRIVAPKWEDNIKQVILPKLKAFIPPFWLKGGCWAKAWSEGARTLSFANGSTCRMFTYQQDADVFSGADLDFVHFDEPPPYKIWIENLARLTDRNGIAMLTQTADLGIAWTRDEIEGRAGEDPDIGFWKFRTFDNPHLSPEGVSFLDKQIRDENLRRVKLYGDSAILSGAVLPMFNPAIHVIPDRPLHKDAARVFCIDLHLKTPSAAMWAAWEPSGQLVIYRTAKRSGTVPEWKQFIRAKSAGEKIHGWYGDESERETGVTNIYGEDSIIAKFNEFADGGPIPIQQVEKGAGSFEGGIYKLRDMLMPDPVSMIPQIVIFKSCDYPVEYMGGKACGSLIWEIERYRFKSEHKADEETLREKVVNVDDHLISDARYLCMIGSPVMSGGFAGWGAGLYGG